MSWSLLFICLLLWGLVILLLIAVEHGYFSSAPARWLYNICAPLYRGKWKRNVAEYSAATTERLFLAPMLEALRRTDCQHVADLGCGTGRLSLALLGSERFRGTIEAYDFSPQMLKIFHQELAHLPESARTRVVVSEQNLESWRSPSTETRYGAVFLVEAGEFVVNIRSLLAEIGAHIPAGGVLILTKPKDWYSRFLLGRPLTRRALENYLVSVGFQDISFHPWTNRHEVVWAWRSGLRNE